MTRAHAYNSLGQILAHEGEVSLGIAISRGLDKEQAAALISQRYPDLPQQDADLLYDMALGGSQAAQYLNTLRRELKIPLEAIPINRQLFGDDPLGRRLFVAAEVTNPVTGETINVREPVDFSDTLQQILDYIGALVDQWIEQSPDLANKLAGDDGSVFESIFLFAERRF